MIYYYLSWFWRLTRLNMVVLDQIVRGWGHPKLPYSHAWWEILALGWDIGWECCLEHLYMVSPCGLVFLTAWQLGSKSKHS